MKLDEWGGLGGRKQRGEPNKRMGKLTVDPQLPYRPHHGLKPPKKNFRENNLEIFLTFFFLLVRFLMLSLVGFLDSTRFLH